MKKLNAVLVYLIISVVSGLAGKIAFTTSIIYRVQEVGLDALQLVLVGTTLELAVFLFEIPTGIVADTNSRRTSIIIGNLLVGIGFIIEGLAPIYWVVLLSQIVWGFGWTFISGAFTAWITDEVGVDKVGQIFLRGRQLFLMGSLVGVPISVVMAKQSLATPFLVGGSLRVLLGLFLMRFMPETGFKRRVKEERETWRDLLDTSRSGIKAIRESSLLLIFVAIAFFVGLYSEGWDRLGEAHLLENFKFPQIGSLNLDIIDWFGILSIAVMLLGLVGNEITKRRVDTSNAKEIVRSLQGLYTLMVISILTFALNNNFWLAIGTMTAFDLLRSLTHPLSTTWLNMQIESEVRATILSFEGQVDAFGQMLGGPLIGIVGRLRSLRAAIIGASIILFSTIPLYQSILKKTTGKKISNLDYKSRYAD
ncbi:MAG: MFS transporter [Chloroflexota bacterium]